MILVLARIPFKIWKISSFFSMPSCSPCLCSFIFTGPARICGVTMSHNTSRIFLTFSFIFARFGRFGGFVSAVSLVSLVSVVSVVSFRSFRWFRFGRFVSLFREVSKRALITSWIQNCSFHCEHVTYLQNLPCFLTPIRWPRPVILIRRLVAKRRS